LKSLKEMMKKRTRRGELEKLLEEVRRIRLEAEEILGGKDGRSEEGEKSGD